MTDRRFSLEEDFMNFNTNDLLYGFMRGLSTARPTGKYKNNKELYQEYLTKKEFNKNKKLIAGICNCSTKTINRHIEKLFEAGLLAEGVETVSVNNKNYEYDCYYFPYDEKGRYKILDQKIVRYLVHTRNSQGIRIFLYLLNKYQWKKDYIFTIEEIATGLGYAESTKSCHCLIRDCLASFKAEGIIRFNIVEVPIETSKDLRGKTYKMQLEYMIENPNELPAIFK